VGTWYEGELLPKPYIYIRAIVKMYVIFILNTFKNHSISSDNQDFDNNDKY